MQIAPWEEVVINLIGPWMVKVNTRKVECNALTHINTASNLRDKLGQAWLSQYSPPIHYVYDQDGEFIGGTFQWLRHSFDIKDEQSTAKNLQLTSICKHMHQTVGKYCCIAIHRRI
eukprot:CCRYP_002868-RA/>CCRYP_002868-RA protein AED:0.47 eAED:0.47 QI:0/0/0/1/0/0/2/0/115